MTAGQDSVGARRPDRLPPRRWLRRLGARRV